MLGPTTSNTFPERTQPASVPVIINKELKYKISQIIDIRTTSKDCSDFVEMMTLGSPKKYIY